MILLPRTFVLPKKLQPNQITDVRQRLRPRQQRAHPLDAGPLGRQPAAEVGDLVVRSGSTADPVEVTVRVTRLR